MNHNLSKWNDDVHIQIFFKIDIQIKIFDNYVRFFSDWSVLTVYNVVTADIQ